MYGGTRVTQHVIEFIPGTGMVTDGATDATSPSGPWTWTVPDNFIGDLMVDCISGGGGGSGGGAAAGGIVSVGGGGGGGAYAVLAYSLLSVLPNEAITVTVGAGGAGGAVGAQGTNGGTTSLVAPTGGAVANGCSHRAVVANILLALEVLAGAGAATSSGAAAGGASQQSTANVFLPNFNTLNYINQLSFGTLLAVTGGGGGNGGATGGVNGSGGNGYASTKTAANFSMSIAGMVGAGPGTGNTAGGVSKGGGGAGASLPGFLGGAGGNGNVAGANAPGLCGGGGGGGGNAAGGNGGAGYVRIMYLSLD